MEKKKRSKERQEVLKKIKRLEAEGRFDEGVEPDLPAPELLPSQVDYLCEKVSSRGKRFVANFLADRYFLRLIRKGMMVIDGIVGEEHLAALQNGAVVTCNHFSPFDHYIVFHCIRRHLPKKYLYKVIREGNYTNFPGLYGFFFRHCNTLPLSRNRRTMMNFFSATNTLLRRGETILVYPEQEMWWNYRKPRPFKIGAFRMAYKANVPVVPMLITMCDDEERMDADGYPLQRHTLHVLPPIYPDATLGEKKGAEAMMETAQQLCKKRYEDVYGVPLVYGGEME